MTVHLKKLSVGSTSLESLAEWQQQVLARHGRLLHVTRSFPRRSAEVLDGGSIYWVIKGWMLARQSVVDLVEMQRQDGKPACGIVLEGPLVPVLRRRSRPFQGWRYLETTDAPPDLPAGTSAGETMPEAMAEELRELGLL